MKITNLIRRNFLGLQKKRAWVKWAERNKRKVWLGSFKAPINLQIISEQLRTLGTVGTLGKLEIWIRRKIGKSIEKVFRIFKKFSKVFIRWFMSLLKLWVLECLGRIMEISVILRRWKYFHWNFEVLKFFFYKFGEKIWRLNNNWRLEG